MCSVLLRRSLFALACLNLLLFAACSEPERPLTREEIEEQREKVPTLYITESGKEFIAPGNRLGALPDPETGEIGWRAWQCTNPDCPGEKQEGRPHLFIRPVPNSKVGTDGQVILGMPQTPEESATFLEVYGDGSCPACREVRDRENETPEQAQQYSAWVSVYVLPEAQEELDRLQKAHDAYVERMKRFGGMSDGGS